jgi:hypothetical protein
VVLNDEPLVCVAVHGDVLQIAGSGRAVSRLASELRLFLAENDLREPGVHTQFDAGQGMSRSAKDILVAEGSAPLMVSGPVY